MLVSVESFPGVVESVLSDGAVGCVLVAGVSVDVAGVVSPQLELNEIQAIKSRDLISLG